MIDYVYEYGARESSTARMDAIAKGHGFSLKKNGTASFGITSSLKVMDSGERNCYLSEFPGNCSALVLSAIQAYFECNYGDVLKTMLDFSVDFCKELDYGFLFITTTDEDFKKLLEDEYGFHNVMGPVVNPHSNNTNYFMVLDIVKE